MKKYLFLLKKGKVFSIKYKMQLISIKIVTAYLTLLNIVLRFEKFIKMKTKMILIFVVITYCYSSIIRGKIDICNNITCTFDKPLCVFNICKEKEFLYLDRFMDVKIKQRHHQIVYYKHIFEISHKWIKMNKDNPIELKWNKARSGKLFYIITTEKILLIRFFGIYNPVKPSSSFISTPIVPVSSTIIERSIMPVMSTTFSTYRNKTVIIKHILIVKRNILLLYTLVFIAILICLFIFLSCLKHFKKQRIRVDTIEMEDVFIEETLL